MNKMFFSIFFCILYMSAYSQSHKKENLSINPFIDAFYENLLEKDVNLDKNFLTIICIEDKSKNKNIDFDLTTGDINIDAKKVDFFNRKVIKYGNVKILLIGKTVNDIVFLKKVIKTTAKTYINKDINLNNTSFYDEEYVWSLLFNNKNELVNIFIPEEKDCAYKIFNNVKDKIKINRSFKGLEFNNW